MKAALFSQVTCTLVLCISFPQTAFANCNAVARLAGFYALYNGTLDSTNPLRNHAAARLYSATKSLDIEAFADALALPDTHPLERMTLDAQVLSHGAITRTQGVVLPQRRHTENIAWMERIVFGSGCNYASSSSRGTTSSPIPTAADNSKNAPPAKQQTPSPKLTRTLVIIAAGGLLAVFLMLAATGATSILAIGHSARVKRLQRMPRKLVTFEFSMRNANPTIADLSQTVSCQDVSRGGMKIRVNNTLPSQSRWILDLPIIGEKEASVVWTNNFFAGMMFASDITQKELDMLLDFKKSSISQTRRSAPSTKKTAPESGG